MDTIAALNFGLVIATTLGSFGLTKKRDVLRRTVQAGLAAGSILALVYAMLGYMGMCSSGVYAVQENGAWTLRRIVYQLFGPSGAVLLAAIFTLACLTTCVGLINSISQFFSTLFPRVRYRVWVIVITAFSFLVCNQGLNVILSVSIPILSAIYPMAIVLILLGLTHRLWKSNPYAYPLAVGAAGAVSVLHVLHTLGVPMGFLLPLCQNDFTWLPLSAAALTASAALNRATRRSLRASSSTQEE